MRAPATALPTPIPAAAPGDIECLDPRVVEFAVEFVAKLVTGTGVVVELAMDTGVLDMLETDEELSDELVVELAVGDGGDVVEMDEVLDDESAAGLVLVDEDDELCRGVVSEMTFTV